MTTSQFHWHIFSNPSICIIFICFLVSFFFWSRALYPPFSIPEANMVYKWLAGLKVWIFAIILRVNQWTPRQTILISNLIFYHCKASIIISRLQKVYRTPIEMKEPSYFFLFNRCLFPEGKKHPLFQSSCSTKENRQKNIHITSMYHWVWQFFWHNFLHVTQLKVQAWLWLSLSKEDDNRSLV